MHTPFGLCGIYTSGSALARANTAVHFDGDFDISMWAYLILATHWIHAKNKMVVVSIEKSESHDNCSITLKTQSP